MKSDETEKEYALTPKEVYTMITGATGGLGEAFVRIAAKNGENLILSGRYEGKLRLLKEKILAEHTGIDVLIYAADLSDAASRASMMRAIAEAHLKIARLINVAGADIQKPFSDYTQCSTRRKRQKLSIFPAFRGSVPCPILPFTAR